MAHPKPVAVPRRSVQLNHDIYKELQNIGYFFSDVTDLRRVKELLRNQSDGTFLLRRKISTNHSGILSLSVKYFLQGDATDLWHMNVMEDNGKVYIDHAFKFGSLTDLIDHYKLHNISVGTAGVILLRQPLLAESSGKSAIARRPPKPPPRTPPNITVATQAFSSQQAAVALRRHMSRLHTLRHRQARVPENWGSIGLLEDAPKMDVATQPSAHAENASSFSGGTYDLDTVPSDMVNLYELSGDIQMCSSGQETPCDCGLNFEDAQLPSGWTMHMSHEPQTKGYLFFKDPSGYATWTLPLTVIQQLTEYEERKLKRLMVVTAGSGSAASSRI